MKHLAEMGCINKTKGPRKELAVIMDNCGGQKKNRMVIRLAPLIVELGLYKKVNFAFLVARHTKNSCDHLFNILKLKYRKSDIFSIEMLVKTVNQCHLVDAVRAKEDDFKDYDKFLNLIYKGIESGTVNRAHIFQCDSQNPTTADPGHNSNGCT